MKGQYNIYPTFTNIATQTARKTIDKKISSHDAVRGLFDHVPEMQSSINYSILSEEHYWFEQSQVVIFPESVDILEKLSQAKFSITKSSGISFPHDCFFLAFPKGYTLSGMPANGCMISYMKRTDRFRCIHEPYYKYMNLGIPMFEPDEHKISMYITYINPHEDEMLIRACIPTDVIADCLAAKDHAEYGRIVGNFDIDKVSGAIPLNDQDLRYQFELFQIVTRMGVYSTSCSNALRAGYPHVRPKHLEPKGLTYKDFTLGMASEVKSKSMHYRSWYFRQLTHKKYYQGEHAKKPIGSRIVFVKDTMIGQDIEAETLEWT